jgi:hypothetical protein
MMAATATREAQAVSVHDTNDPEQILKHPLYEILMRLSEDSNKLEALGAVDQAVLRGLVDRDKTPKSEQEEKLEQALRCMEAVRGGHSTERFRGSAHDRGDPRKSLASPVLQPRRSTTGRSSRALSEARESFLPPPG